MSDSQMNVIACFGAGAPETLHIATRPLPAPQAGEVLVRVAAAGVNRADIMQRQGKYPPPPGASDILGMEISGTITALGVGVKEWKIGDTVCALLSGGGYAEYVAVPAAHCLPVPAGVSLHDAAALPEAIITVYANLFEDGGFQAGQTALVHGGSSGIGTMAIQMAKAIGGSIIVTVGSEAKSEACYALGADLVINYREDDYVINCWRATHDRGVDVVLDMVGGAYVNRNLQCLCRHGKHISIATQSAKSDVNLRYVMQGHLTLTGSTLRGRSAVEKTRLIAEIRQKIWPLVEQKKIKPVIYQAFPLKDAAEAHKVMETSAHIGKMLLEVS